ncbi:hypothetical protein J6590_010095 [Homalodisca vitripennis]|nr:hypothetical protein J6590_059683 [Homalodisca vitripennis]KAG8292410.1 hypothetical protein J6590_041522 [Homalodisca vitripennis]KAG8313003.1 hypothetical protein J6590_010095 [Homalodisca vitripennis]
MSEIDKFFNDIFNPKNLNAPIEQNLNVMTGFKIYSILKKYNGVVPDNNFSFLNIFTEYGNQEKLNTLQDSFQTTLKFYYSYSRGTGNPNILHRSLNTFLQEANPRFRGNSATEYRTVLERGYTDGTSVFPSKAPSTRSGLSSTSLISSTDSALLSSEQIDGGTYSLPEYSKSMIKETGAHILNADVTENIPISLMEAECVTDDKGNWSSYSKRDVTENIPISLMEAECVADDKGNWSSYSKRRCDRKYTNITYGSGVCNR